jgi:hypothetical protein
MSKRPKHKDAQAAPQAVKGITCRMVGRDDGVQKWRTAKKTARRGPMARLAGSVKESISSGKAE